MSSVYNTPEWSAWLASIREMPGDDNRRLFAADYLEERGEVERAGWIRYAVELPHCEFTWMVDSSQNRPGELLGLHGWAWAGDHNGSYLIHGQLRYRIDRGFVHTVRGPLVSLIGGVCGRCDGRGCPLCGGEDRDYHDTCGECPDCNGTGRTPVALRELVRREPVATVEVTDREPMPSSSRDQTGPCIWWDANHQGGSTIHPQSDLPTDLFFCLEGEHLTTGSRWYPTADAARAALSSAILRLVQPVEVPT